MASRGFTEAIPLSLSSMAHLTIPLDEGVLDGLKMVLQHTLLSCLNLTRAIYPPHSFTFSDLCTTPYAWEPHEVVSTPQNNSSNVPPIPASLTKHGFDVIYQRSALLYFKPLLVRKQHQRKQRKLEKKEDVHGRVPPVVSQQEELEWITRDIWTEQEAALAKITLIYASPGELSADDLAQVGVAYGQQQHDDAGGAAATKLTHPCVLYKVLVEYRSLPSTGKSAAVKAEELSMLSFGGSVDDDVKYGALSSLYDDHAKYVLEISSVRGKKYKFDLMDSTLSDGTVPRLPARPGTSLEEQANDPFVKSLCVTVTENIDATVTSTNSKVGIAKAAEPQSSKEGKSDDKETYYDDDNDHNGKEGAVPELLTPATSLTKIQLRLEGNLRVHLDKIPPPAFYSTRIQETFLSLNHQPPSMVVGYPSGHRLLLDPKDAGKIYINGRYVTTWGKDPKIGSTVPALFGMDLHSIPYWHGRIFDYDALMASYSQLWQEVMTDARLVHQNTAGRLLSRLINGKDPFLEEDDDDEEEDDDDFEDEDEEDEKPEVLRIHTDVDCLESQVMSSSKYDPVGISAKALATKFAVEYGEDSFPCQAHEIDWVKERLPGRVPVVVPARLIDVLRRGGYFDTKRTSDEVWFSESQPAKEGSREEIVVERACALLEDAKCTDVTPSTIVFFTGAGISEPVRLKGLVRWNRQLRQYHVNVAFMCMDLDAIEDRESMVTTTEDVVDNGDAVEESKETTEKLALLLGLHIAREHPDGSVFIRYMLKHGNMATA